MAKHCRACGLPLDEDHHDVVRVGPLETFPFRGFKNGQRQRLTYVRRPRKRVYGCRVRLVATSPISGKTLTPGSPQRIKEVDTRYVRTELLEAQADG